MRLFEVGDDDWDKGRQNLNQREMPQGKEKTMGMGFR